MKSVILRLDDAGNIITTRDFPIIMKMPTEYVYPIEPDEVGDNYFAQKQIHMDLYKKFFKKWLLKYYSDYLGYLKFANDKISIINTNEEYNKNKNASASEIEQKIDYIKENILTKEKTKKILSKIVKKKKMKWYNLPYNEKMVRKIFSKYLKKKLTKAFKKT